MTRRTPSPRLTSIAVTARLDGSFRVAVFPRDPADMSTMPQDFLSHREALTYAERLSARTGWHTVDRVQ
ncbi:hypothetical protein SAMN06297144_3451 [Sphingomonas guangdongensis]|uniref:Uncharacterized protein n=1 Tax=Sphingomonas guangdongensis TaxID=1141890 RepID=A0A285R2G5_9SPHN|nr:hypothetical protein [Sphingomonas guangdongensis]SOB88300.1 hypothetical protein SAMN06297144_3451 [Sphingomonas guangdongensis]